MNEKNFSLLRTFDLNAAKRGEPICFYNDGQLVTFLGESSQHDEDICIRWEETVHDAVKGKCAIVSRHYFRMAPLAWVEQKPVYSGDVVYGKFNGQMYTATPTYWVPEDPAFTWEKPVEKPAEKHEGWINIYQVDGDSQVKALASHVHSTKAHANAQAGNHRIACIRVEWEEPAGGAA